MATKQDTVVLAHRFPIKRSEAAAILEHLVRGGHLPDQLVHGPSTLGKVLWRSLKEGGYVAPTGNGAHTPARLDQKRFAQTLFVLEPREDLQQFKKANKRPQGLAGGQTVARDAWIRTLERIAGAQVRERGDGAAAPSDAESTSAEAAEVAPAKVVAAPPPPPEPAPAPAAPSRTSNGALRAPLLARRAEVLAALDAVRMERDAAVAQLHELETKRVDAERKAGALEGRERALGEELTLLTDLLIAGE